MIRNYRLRNHQIFYYKLFGENKLFMINLALQQLKDKKTLATRSSLQSEFQPVCKTFVLRSTVLQNAFVRVENYSN